MELDAVINSAASVNFREELDKALTINTLCLENIAQLARMNPALAVLQVSTCYVNGMNSGRSEEHTSELQSRPHLVCRLLLEKKNQRKEALTQLLLHESCQEAAVA